MKNYIDLCQGGESWHGWRFGRYGRARDWRLIAPDGTHYSAGDVWGLQGAMLNIDYLAARVRDLEAQLDGRALHITREEAAAVEAAALILIRACYPGAPLDRRARAA